VVQVHPGPPFKCGYSHSSPLNAPPNYDECAVDRLYGLGCVHGTIVDESGKPISHIEVDIIPIHKTGDARWYGIHNEWTDDQGRYNLNRMEPGEYFLGANAFSSFGAPDAERPFATAYYPAAENESEAAVAKVVRSSPLQLSPLRLRKLEVVTIKNQRSVGQCYAAWTKQYLLQKYSLSTSWRDGTTDRQRHGRIHTSKRF